MTREALHTWSHKTAFVSHVAGLSHNVAHGCTAGRRRHGALPGRGSWAVSGSGHCVPHLAFGTGGCLFLLGRPLGAELLGPRVVTDGFPLWLPQSRTGCF